MLPVRADRGTSVRIPRPVAAQGHGYLEDRRPAANADPYRVAARLLETVCGAGAPNHDNGQAGRGGGRQRTGRRLPVRRPAASANGVNHEDSWGE